MNISATITLKKGREQSVKRLHPWVFSGAIQSMDNEPADGGWVKVNGSDGETLGFGHYQKGGSITVRLLSFSPDAPATDFWFKKIAAAWRQRRLTEVLDSQTNACRIIHAEGDGLPGLVIDFYNGNAVLQAHSAGMHDDRQQIAEALKEVLTDRLTAVYYKSMSASPGKQSGYILGAASVPHEIVEHGNKFFVDWEEGQKTGFFLDQRENRKLLGHFAKDKTLLNTFCYTGGFSVYGLQAGAKLVHSVDASQKAIDLTRRNIALNGFDPGQHESYAIDTFEFLKDKKDVYDFIVLDPPAFAKHKDSRHQAMKGYQRLNAEAMRVIRSGGIIFTFSCSQVVDRQLFYDTVVSSAIQTGRNIKVLHHLSQPADHPVSVYHPEGDYLKGLVLYVE